MISYGDNSCLDVLHTMSCRQLCLDNYYNWLIQWWFLCYVLIMILALKHACALQI